MADYGYAVYPGPGPAYAPQPAYGAPPGPAYAPQPTYGAYAPPGVPYGAPYAHDPAAPNDEVRTLFITGFPEDVKERELNNMLRFLPGYEVAADAHQQHTPDTQPRMVFSC